MSMTRTAVVKLPHANGASREETFELKWAENGALLISFANDENAGQLFHWVGDEDDFISFIENELGGNVLRFQGELGPRPTQGTYSRVLGYMPPCPCGCEDDPLALFDELFDEEPSPAAKA